MPGLNTEQYDEPIGAIGQRIAGVVLFGFTCLATAAGLIGLIHGGERFILGALWFNVLVVAAAPVLFTLSTRLILARATDRELLGPRVLIASGFLALLGTAWFVSEIIGKYTLTGSGRAVLGGATCGAMAIVVGVRRLRYGSRPEA